MLKSKKYFNTKIICEYESSNLLKAEYDIQTKLLEVLFKNDIKYVYNDVPHEVFIELNLSESQGKYFNKNIAKVFNYKKV
jgi:hypothetical protein